MINPSIIQMVDEFQNAFSEFVKNLAEKLGSTSNRFKGGLLTKIINMM